MKRDMAACGSELDQHYRMGFRIGISCLLPITCVHLQSNVLPALQGGMYADPGSVPAPSGPCGALGAEKHWRSYRFGSDVSKREEERRRTALGGTRGAERFAFEISRHREGRWNESVHRRGNADTL